MSLPTPTPAAARAIRRMLQALAAHEQATGHGMSEQALLFTMSQILLDEPEAEAWVRRELMDV